MAEMLTVSTTGTNLRLLRKQIAKTNSRQKDWRSNCGQMMNFETYVWVSDQSNIPMFCPKKLISQSTVPAESPFFEEMILAHYTLMPIFFWTPLTPPICLKMTKCAIFSTFWESHFKNTPKVGVHRENFNIGNLSQIFFGDFYTC